MRSTIFAAISAALALSACSGTMPAAGLVDDGTASAECVAAIPSDVRTQMRADINAQRAAAGLPPLRPNAALDIAAQRHACEQAERRYFSHTGADGSSVVDRVTRAGFATCLTAENIAWGQRDAGVAMRSFMGSAGHRENILRPRVEQVGIGYAPAEFGRGPQWVQVFARPC